MKKTQVIKGPEFLALLAKERGAVSNENLLVEECDLTINGEKLKLKDVRLNGITFTGQVTITGLRNPKSNISLESCNFLRGLSIESCACNNLSITSSTAPNIGVSSSQFDYAYLHSVTVEKSIDISGLQLNGRLGLYQTHFGELELLDRMGNYTAMPMAMTDNPLVALQLRLAGIAVFVPSVTAREILKNGTTKVASAT